MPYPDDTNNDVIHDDDVKNDDKNSARSPSRRDPHLSNAAPSFFFQRLRSKAAGCSDDRSE